MSAHEVGGPLQVLEEALARPAKERNAYLDEACAGDADLRRAVDALLAEQLATNGFLESPAWTPERPRLNAGTRLGPYEIQSFIGAGGMGEVYKARDTRLGRTVAVKVLPPGVAMDPTRRLRFEREARAASALNHPHICTLHDLCEHEGQPFIVMELLDGQTVRERLHRGPFEVARVIGLSIQIADALEAAHRVGVIHRDIKPGNVFVTLREDAKILDFGLAKLELMSGASAGHSSSAGAELGGATTHPVVTASGALVGTIPYMSPEQLGGEEVDHRTDIFSFGALIYEMATGRPPFIGRTPALVFDAILHESPPPPAALNRRLPDGLAPIIAKMIEKDRNLRYQSAGEVKVDLKRLERDLSPVPRPPIPASRPRRVFTAALALAIIAGISVAIAILGPWRRPLAPKEANLPATTIMPVVTDPSIETDARISPDKRWLSFLSDRDGPMRLFVQAIDIGRAPGPSGEAHRVDVPGEAVVSHAWSPDGLEFTCVVRYGAAMTLEIVPAFRRGQPRMTVPLVPNPQNVRVSRWIGNSIYLDVARGADGNALWRIDLAGVGEPQFVDVAAKWAPARLEGQGGFDVSPDGDRVVFSAKQRGEGEHFDLWVARTDGSDLHPLTDDGWVERNPVWVGRTGRVAFQSNQTGQLDLWEIDVATLRTFQVVTSNQTASVPSDATADGGTLVCEQKVDSAALWVFNAARRFQQITANALSDTWPSVDRIGRQIVFQRTRPLLKQGTEYYLDARVFTATLSAENHVLEERPVGDGFAARSSADGSWVAYLEAAPSGNGYRLLAHNVRTGETHRAVWAVNMPAHSNLAPYDLVEQHVTWSRTGALLYFVNVANGEGRIERMDLNGSERGSETVVASRGDRFWDIRLSADGNRLAYLARSGHISSTGEFHLRVRDLRSGLDESVCDQVGPPTSMFLRGWTENGGLLLLRSRTEPDRTNTIDLVEIGIGRRPRPIMTVAGSFVATARLDDAGAHLYVTRTERGIHNIYAVRLADGAMVPVTTNEQRGVSFSGIEPMPSGGICYSQSRLSRDIVLALRGTR